MYELIASFIFLISVLLYLVFTTKPEPTQTQIVFQPPPPRPIATQRAPEFRGPPIKQYKPRDFQQMGLLVNDNETLPLYGRESRTHRDRYHYYSSTPGNQIYSLPVSYDGRDCSEDIGCPELYGNETVTVTGRDGEFTANIYRTENFPQFY